MDNAACPAFHQISSIHEVAAEQWNALAEQTQPGYPFLRHEFLSALEDSGAASPQNGWLPAHVLGERDNELVAAAPVYQKHNSFGEFVFDFVWADAYQRVGLNYYPKLVCAIPFNPVTGPRLLHAGPETRQQLAAFLCDLPDTTETSSFHMLFAWHHDREAANQASALFRRDCQFLWFNRGHASFDDFLAGLSSKRRKEIRRERRRLHDAGIKVRVLTPSDINEQLWATLYDFYARTYHMRGQQPYLNPAFFHQLATTMPEAVRFFVAYDADRPIGMAFMLLGNDTLYGRHWGCETDIDGLHFETCYYAGIEYCIEHGLSCFDAGAQGEHKLRRGFDPVITYSAHTIREPRLRAAIADFVEREGAFMAEVHDDYRAHSAFPDDAESAP